MKLDRISLKLLVAVAALMLAGCAKPEGAGPTRAAPAPEVGVLTVKPQPVSITTELAGRTSAYLIAEVRPQVGGIIQERQFVEGADVTAGQALYQIDPASYQASVASAEAALAKAEANLASARVKSKRYAELAQIHAVSRQDSDDALANSKQATADVLSAGAALDAALINLGYTKVTAPISGRVGKSSVTPGALVTANQERALTTVQQLDSIYVDVTQSSTELLRLKRELANGALERDSSNTKVRLLLEDGNIYPHEGTLQFSDVTVDQSTAMVTLRVVFPNPDKLLLPGMYVRTSVDVGVRSQAILVPQQGVSRDPKGNATALVVGADGKVEQRTLSVSRAVGNEWLVDEGLKAGDRLIVAGLQKVAPGVLVKAVAVPTDAEGALANTQAAGALTPSGAK